MRYNRDFCINELIMNDLDSIFGDRGSDDYGVEFTEMMLRNGFKGYDNMTDDEIMQEMTERDISYLNGEDDDDNLSC